MKILNFYWSSANFKIIILDLNFRKAGVDLKFTIQLVMVCIITFF